MPHSTNNRSPGLARFATAVRKAGLLTTVEERELAARIRKGDASARDRMIRSNVLLVMTIAHEFRGRGLQVEDLTSEGILGLTRAVAKFDPNKGAKFSTYAAWWIKQAMRRAVADQGSTIRVPPSARRNLARIQAARLQLAEELGRNPVTAEIAAATGLSARAIKQLDTSAKGTTSLHEVLGSDTDGELGDLVADPAAVIPGQGAARRDLHEHALATLTLLSPREQLILRRRFGLDDGTRQTLGEVAAALGCSRERVRQLQVGALAVLRRWLDDGPVRHRRPRMTDAG